MFTNDVNINDTGRIELYNNLRKEMAPTGAYIWFGSTVIPAGWLLCNGQAVSRTTYADLFGVIGILYGSGDGSTTFNIPDVRGKIIIGTSSTKTIGSTGGTSTITLTLTNLPSHLHNIDQDGVHVHWVIADKDEVGGVPVFPAHLNIGGSGLVGRYNTENNSHTHTIGTKGGSTSIVTTPPSVVLNALIKY